MFEQLFARNGLSFDRLRVLLELDEAGSLVKAAGGDETRGTQYSRQIKQLSEYFGTALTELNGRELKLTADGKRLVRLIREMFIGLEEFQRSCGEATLDVSFGAGDSLLQWVLLPRMRRIQEKLKTVGLKGVRFTLRNLRNEEIAEQLAELKLDLGLLREGAVPPRHKKERIVQVQFAVFVPKKLPSTSSKLDYKFALQHFPLVQHNPGGDFVGRLVRLAQQENIVMNHCLTTEGFPQACRAVQSGRYAAILPTVARGDLRSEDYLEIEWPALKAEARWVALAWNERRVGVKPALEKVVNCLKAELAK